MRDVVGVSPDYRRLRGYPLALLVASDAEAVAVAASQPLL